MEANFTLLLVNVFAKLFTHVEERLGGGRYGGGRRFGLFAWSDLSKRLMHESAVEINFGVRVGEERCVWEKTQGEA